ncbi:MAG: citrate transporter [Clostridia bacterium]|nr:citrate transporter [Clostridia bacterium]
MQSDVFVGILGLLTIAAIVLVLFKSKMQPAFAFIVFPAILVIVLVLIGRIRPMPAPTDDDPDKMVGTFGVIGNMIKAGFNSTAPTAALFVFSVLYFGIMTDAGMFDVIISKLMKLVGDSVIGVCIVTAIIALVGHLDGGGASTFCIVIPAMLPVYKRMHMRPTTLLRIAVLAMGVLNLMPWAGPTMRAASVMGMEAGILWKTILPIQIFGIVLALVHAVLSGLLEKRRGAGLHGKLAEKEGEIDLKEALHEQDSDELKRPKLFVVNILLTLGIIAMLIFLDDLPSYVPFMIGCALALFINYGFNVKTHKKIINLHAGPALMMCSTLMGAAILMGVLTTSIGPNGAAISAKTMELKEGAIPSVVRCLAGIISSILPSFLGQHLPLIIGVLSVPLALAFDTDSYFYGMLPVMIGIGQAFGVNALPIAVAMVVCRNCATFISPMVPATLLGTGLAEVEIKDHIKASFLYVWGFSILCMLFAALWGIMPL